LVAALLLVACGGGEPSANPGGAGASGSSAGGSSGAGATGGSDASASGGTAGSADGGADAAVAVARVTLGEPATAVAPGGSITLTAKAYDANDQEITATLTWQSSDPIIATVSEGVVTGVALGQTSVTASAGGVSSMPVVVWVNPAGSTSDALDKAVAAGEITEDQALVYAVWAAFNDSRLPGKYRSTVSEPSLRGDLLMLEAAGRFDFLTTDQQDAIAQYFVPPIYETTATAGAPGTGQFLEVFRPGICSGVVNGNWISTATLHFRVWYNSATMPQAAPALPRIAQYAEDAYQKLVAEKGFNPPLEDTGLCNGGDGKLDIYVAEPSQTERGMMVPTTDNWQTGLTTPAFMLIPVNTIPANPGSDNDLQATIAHELMHAVQFAYAHLTLESYRWFLESTATWAKDVVYPNTNTEHPYASPYMTRPEEPLFFPNKYRAMRPYGSYLFFQFATKKGSPDLVRKIFEFADDDPLGSIDFALSATGQEGLRRTWPQFALALWNRDPIKPEDSFGWDGLVATPPDSDSTAIQLGATDPPRQIVAPSLKSAGGYAPVNELSMVYDRYTIGAGVSTLIFYNGFSQNLSTMPVGVQDWVGPVTHLVSRDAGSNFIVYDTPEDTRKGRQVWAMKKIQNKWSVEDWTNKPFVALCLDKAAERVDELVLVFSNGNYTTVRSSAPEANAVGSIGAQKSTLVASPIPCYKYEGDAEAKLVFDDGTDKFEATTDLLATYVGRPHTATATTATGSGSLFLGWRFTADAPSVILTTTFKGTLKSCNPNYSIEDTTLWDANFYAGVALPGFTSLLVAPGPSPNYAYAGAGHPIRYEAEQCAGATKFMPALNTLDFNLYLTQFQTGDLANLRLTSGTDGVPGPVYDQGAYTNPGEVTNKWCLTAFSQNDQGQDVPRIGVCP
jgi:hypothetical protein